MPVTRHALCHYLTRGNIHHRENGGGALADVVVGVALDLAQALKKQLDEVQGVYMRQLIIAEHQGAVRRVQVQAGVVSYLLNE